MDDNALVHTSGISKRHKEENQINVTDWPAQTPDLNVIENMWLRLKRVIEPQSVNINTPEHLMAAERHAWENTPDPVECIQEFHSTIPT